MQDQPSEKVRGWGQVCPRFWRHRAALGREKHDVGPVMESLMEVRVTQLRDQRNRLLDSRNPEATLRLRRMDSKIKAREMVIKFSKKSRNFTDFGIVRSNMGDRRKLEAEIAVGAYIYPADIVSISGEYSATSVPCLGIGGRHCGREFEGTFLLPDLVEFDADRRYKNRNARYALPRALWVKPIAEVYGGSIEQAFVPVRKGNVIVKVHGEGIANPNMSMRNFRCYRVAGIFDHITNPVFLCVPHIPEDSEWPSRIPESIWIGLGRADNKNGWAFVAPKTTRKW